MPTITLDQMKAAMSAHITAFEAMTEDDHRRIALAEVSESLATRIECWPEALSRLSIPQVQISLTEIEAEMMAAAFEDGAPPPASLSERIEAATAGFQNGFFIRLGSRSPKDSYLGEKDGFCCQDGALATALLCDSERIWEDVRRDLRVGQPIFVFAREWQDIPAWAEFRCVITDGQLAAISQYDYRTAAVYSEIADRPDVVEAAIAAFVERRVIPACHLTDVVVDIAFDGGDLDRPFLLEINPHGDKTDPTLFRACNPMFSREISAPLFRYHGDGYDYPFTSAPSIMPIQREELVEIELGIDDEAEPPSAPCPGC